MASLQLLAIKSKSWRDLVTDEPFQRSDIITIQNPNNLKARLLEDYDYLKNEKKVGGESSYMAGMLTTDDDLANDPLKGINVEAAGGASKVLKMLAEKVRKPSKPSLTMQTKSEQPSAESTPPPAKEKEGVVAKRQEEQLACEFLVSGSHLTTDNATNFTTGRQAASLTSTSWAPQVKNERELLDEEEYMFDELKKPTKEKERLKSKAYATIMTNFGGLNVELHGDRAPKTVYNFVQLAKEGKYDNVVFHRLIPGFMVSSRVPISELTSDPRW